MTTLDELERAVERLNRAVERLTDGMGKYGFANVYNDDVQLLLSERAELLATVERMRVANRVLRATPWPREYVLERAYEWARLLREVNGYIKTCRGSCGSDMAGRDHAIDASDKLIAMLSEARAALTTGEGSSADVKPTDGDLWWNPDNYEDGFLHWADAFENANEDGVDYSVELHRARKLPPVWGALVWIDGEQKIKIFATEAEADEARVTEGVKP